MKHKHYDLIVAWAEGKKIQNFNDNTNQWETIDGDMFWVSSFKYRIEPKPDRYTFLIVTDTYTGAQTTSRWDRDTVRFTYDGETGKLKSAEVLK